jgi:hypothetical protein
VSCQPSHFSDNAGYSAIGDAIHDEAVRAGHRCGTI